MSSDREITMAVDEARSHYEHLQEQHGNLTAHIEILTHEMQKHFDEIDLLVAEREEKKSELSQMESDISDAQDAHIQAMNEYDSHRFGGM